MGSKNKKRKLAIKALKNKKSKKRTIPLRKYLKRPPRFINLGTSHKLLCQKRHSKLIAELKKRYDKGIISTLVFLAFGQWTKGAIRDFSHVLKKAGNDWAINFVVFQNPEETRDEFVLRIAKSFDIQFVFDTELDLIRSIVTCDKLTHINVFRICENQRREAFWEWLIKHKSTYLEPFNTEPSSFTIIRTGVEAETIH